MAESSGATPSEWAHFIDVLGLAANVLPCVPAAANVPLLPGSALAGKLGKIPSVFNSDGYAHGIKGWSSMLVPPENVASWAADGRYNVCIRTGGTSRVYALDCDIDTEEMADEVWAELIAAEPLFESASLRGRSNSSKFLYPFALPGGSTCKKRIIKTAHGRIELLGDGQQFVAAGQHSSGVRYDWLPALPSSMPALTLTRIDEVWGRLAARFSAESTASRTRRENGAQTSNQTAKPDVETQISDANWAELLQALQFLLDKVADNDSWSSVGYALLSLRSTRPVDRLWLDFSSKAQGYLPGKPEEWWSAHADAAPRSDYRHIFALARSHGWQQHSDPGVFGVSAVAQTTQQDVLLPAPEKPICRTGGGALPGLIDQCTKFMQPELYVHGGALTRIGRSSEMPADETKRDPDQDVMSAVTPEWVRDRLGRLAIWQRFDGRAKSWVVTDCPADIARVFWGRGTWALRPIDAIATAPFMREDGSICDDPGYDGSSATLYVPNAVFPRLADSPTKADALRAAVRLLEPFDQFPFSTDGSRSAYLAHILTEVGRLSVPTSPMFWYSAVQAGSGKSLMSDMPSIIATGRHAPKRSWPHQEEELRKQMFAALLAGDRSLLFDNVPKGHRIRTTDLCALLTSPVWADRVLGSSRNITTRNRLVIVATGNQVTPVGDMARRSVVIRLVAPSGGLAARTFKIPYLRAYATEHRAELLMAALTILKAATLHMASDMANRPVPLASFEEWSARIRDPIMWLGYADPLATQEEETDDEESAGNAAFAALAPTFNAPFTALEVSRIAVLNDTMMRALIQGGCPEPHDASKVGYWLRDNRDRVSGGWKLRGLRLKNGYRCWFFERVDNGDLA